MKNDKAQKVTSREYLMKLIYQTDVTKEEMESTLDKFLVDNFEYIVNRYEELRLQYSNNPEMQLGNLEIGDVVDKEYMISMCKLLNDNSAQINELINKYANNWTIERMPKVDVAVLKLSICEILFVETIPNKVSINEAVEIAKVYCDDKTPKFINGILGSVVNELSER
ncbi:MAG: transcription antitermination factor NusB [Romboutsia sp.]|uniref:transcription antitermination factor NusB n=1 Tax=Romboutsia sp. TaxID=1965302 RepID=UPI003F3392C1